MKVKKYLKYLDNIIVGKDKMRTAKEIIAEIQEMTIEQFEGLSIEEKNSMIREFKSKIPYIRIKFRRQDLKLLSQTDNGEMRYSLATAENKEKIVKQFIKEKKRRFLSDERYNEDLSIIEKSKLLPQRVLLQLKSDKPVNSQLLLEDLNANSEGINEPRKTEPKKEFDVFVD
ncbi:hypothetical protein ES695_08850 [Candidatus Atribacteria bacterium 1244-E10-H5-B2]|nr:MAG: hypothetical protein ES695_08850 [Candidatus Atribacteria bacterium 1244-E10-H5-B2]